MTNLLAHWPLNDTGDTFADASGNGHVGDFNGLGTADIHKGYTVGGRTGAYFHIGQVGDFCPTVAASSAFFLNGSFTVEGYFYFPSDRMTAYPRTTTYMDFPALIAKDDNHDSSGSGWLFYYSEPGQPAANPADLAGAHWKRSGHVRGGAVLTTNTWHHLLWDYDEATTTARTKVNGSVVSTDVIALGDQGGTGLLRFGSNPNYGYHQKARAVFSDLKVWSEVDPVETVAGGWAVGGSRI